MLQRTALSALCAGCAPAVLAPLLCPGSFPTRSLDFPFSFTPSFSGTGTLRPSAVFALATLTTERRRASFAETGMTTPVARSPRREKRGGPSPGATVSQCVSGAYMCGVRAGIVV
ncbi:hypothetical protein OBBRIDRAFT_792921 [Obba rivulosa]|uniref:Secreted protein n=1 Tax=Obba rivulosa TaxID=1052685 RepID=A0A8E2AX79_9APHY|nr:hypothetical protein OBBRIDRAFT_792921 [Obba rivulosa]